jgi:hypothetical protein
MCASASVLGRTVTKRQPPTSLSIVDFHPASISWLQDFDAPDCNTGTAIPCGFSGIFTVPTSGPAGVPTPTLLTPIELILFLLRFSSASFPRTTLMPDLHKSVRSGGCQCGALRYALMSEPTHTSICWCRMCQKASGNYFQAFTGVPRADFVWTRGQPGTFHSSAAVARDYCRECGTPLTYRRIATDRISVTVGSLDQPHDFPSEVQYGIENRPPFADRIAQGQGITSAQSTSRAPGDYASRQHPDHDTSEWATRQGKS